MRVLSGRDFSLTDGVRQDDLAAIVNQRLRVQMFFGRESPLGASIRLANPNAAAHGEPSPLTVVGA